MRALIEILAGLAILANAVIYGTDVFGAIVQRPAIAAVDDRTLTQVMGHIHRVADRRLAAFSIGGLVAAVTGHWVSTAAGALAALAGRVPGNARELQARWDSVINGRVALQTLSLAALCVALAAA
jgi:hypothetical protein